MAGQVSLEPYTQILAHNQQAVPTGSATAVPLAAATARHTILIKNLDTATTIYVGKDATVTTSTGYPIEKGVEAVFTMTAAQPLYVIHAKGSDLTVAWMELGY